MDVTITQDFTFTNANERFMLYDSKLDLEKEYTKNNQRIIMFASKEVT